MGEGLEGMKSSWAGWDGMDGMYVLLQAKWRCFMAVGG